ncbi:MAG: hypothetical protein ACR2KV_07225 [Solirubrobacteraceae bacterium]
MLPDRGNAAGAAGGLFGGWRGRTGRRLGTASLPRPALPVIIGIVLGLGVAAAALLASRIGSSLRPAAARTPAAPAVTFAGVSYRLLGISLTRSIPQRGESAVTASGTFEIVKLRLEAADGRSHVVSRDLIALDAGGTYYAVSSPDDLGLHDRQWGAIGSTTTVPAHGPLTVKAVFDVPPAVPERQVSLHIGQFDPAARTLDLPFQVTLGAPRRRRPRAAPAAIGPLVPSPVLGAGGV